MNRDLLLSTDASYLKVSTSHYQYLTKENIPHNLTGFITNNIRDCVCGYISSDQGFGFFHFYRKNDPEDLKQRIEEDFKNATSIKISLFGGNLVNVFLPQKLAEQDLNSLTKGTKSKETYKDVYRLDLEKNGKKFDGILRESEKYLENSDFLEHDLNLLSKKLKGKRFKKSKFKVYSSGDRNHFKVKGIKDFVGYQNLAKVIYAVQGITLANKSNLKHLYCTAGSSISANFDGSYHAHLREEYGRSALSQDYKIVVNINNAILHRIKYADHFVERDNRDNRDNFFDIEI